MQIKYPPIGTSEHAPAAQVLCAKLADDSSTHRYTCFCLEWMICFTAYISTPMSLWKNVVFWEVFYSLYS